MNTSVLRHRRAAALVIAALAAEAASAAAPVTLAPMFRHHAVLQRDVPLPIWGTAEPGSVVHVSIGPFVEHARPSAFSSTNVVADADGRWRAVLPPRPATLPGDPPNILLAMTDGKYDGIDPSDATLESSEEIAAAFDILFGDVWLCSGQSNMDMNYGWGLTRGKEDVETNTHARIRLFDDRNRTALSPQRDLPDDYGWTPCDPAHAKSFSAVGYFFGQALQEAMPDVPIGLIEASWSGSPIKTWIPYEAAEALGGDFGKQAAERRAVAEAWENGGRDQFKIDLAAWTNALPSIDPDVPNKDWTDKLGAAPLFAREKFDDSDWQTAKLPEITEKHTSSEFDGYVWYRKTFILDNAPNNPAFFGVALTLGPIDDQDWTYVNGVPVGSTNAWDAPRSYEVDPRILHDGTNTIAVKVLDWGGHGGFWSKKPDDIALHIAEFIYVMSDTDGCGSEISGERTIPLAGEWKFKAFPAEPRPVDPSSPSSWDIAACHNGMVAPLFGMAAKGAIWYQGCSDVGNADLYAKQFPAMVGAWRKGFVHDDAGFPVYLVQLAAFKETHAEPLDSAWARMRWTQMQLGETVPHCGTAVAIDVGDHRDIHPKDKKTVGERLARLALARTYRRPGLFRNVFPVPVSARLQQAETPNPAWDADTGFDGTEIRISFDGKVLLRAADGEEAQEKEVSDEKVPRPIPNGEDIIRDWTISVEKIEQRGPFKGDMIRGFEVSDGKTTRRVPAIVREDPSVKTWPFLRVVDLPLPGDLDRTNLCVRYAWDDYPDCNLVNGEGLPCGPFELKIEP